MADIELLIKIPDHLYKLLKDFPSDSNEGNIENVLMKAVEHGIPLPKGHGDLIDRDYLLVDSYCINDLSGNEINIVDVMTVKMADAIIEADKEQE